MVYVSIGLLMLTVADGVVATAERGQAALAGGMASSAAYYWLAPNRAVGLGLGTLHLVGALVVVYIGANWSASDFFNRFALMFRPLAPSLSAIARSKVLALIIFVVVTVILCSIEVAIISSLWTGWNLTGWFNTSTALQLGLCVLALLLWALIAFALSTVAGSPLVAIPLFAWVLLELFVDVHWPALTPYLPGALKNALLAWALPDWAAPGSQFPAAVTVAPLTHTAYGSPVLPAHSQIVAMWFAYALVTYMTILSAYTWRVQRLLSA